MKLRWYILLTSTAVGVIFLTGSWFAIGRTFDAFFRAEGKMQAERIADVTFRSMYELMSQGWKHSQVQRFMDSLHDANASNELNIKVFRSPVVETLYGSIERSEPGPEELKAMETGERLEKWEDGGIYKLALPIRAELGCLSCHTNAGVGSVMGVVTISQPYEKFLQQSRLIFYRQALPSLIIGGLLILAAILWVSRRIGRDVDSIKASLDQINGLEDLHNLRLLPKPGGFIEISRIHQAIIALASRLRSIAVDKNILAFEIGLLEKFVITSDVIKDWQEYVSHLLDDINTILPAPVMFSVCQIDAAIYDVEIFWHIEPDAAAHGFMEESINEALNNDVRFGKPAALNIYHHLTPGVRPGTQLDQDAVVLQVKSLLVEKPQMGSIVGIGVQAATLRDETYQLVLDSILSTVLNVVSSIKALHRYNRDIEHYATRDPLTDLYNQRVLWEFIDYELKRAQQQNSHVALLMIGVDNFKLLNSHYGHLAGDRLLQEFAQATQKLLHKSDIMARCGGDQFGILLPGSDLEQAKARADTLLSMAQQLKVDTGTQGYAEVSISIGIAVAPEHATSPKDMFLFADTLMYKAKSEGKQRVMLPSDQDVIGVFRNRSSLGVAVVQATNARQITPFFQPVVNVAHRSVEAVEVLARLEMDGAFVPADKFIDIAEKTGIIHQVDTVVMERALEIVTGSDFTGRLFFNLSPSALVLSEFTKTLRSLVRQSGINPDRIVFELTERDTVKNLGAVQRLLGVLKTEGFGLAIDDFGSGFSSFHYLRLFNFDYLKIEGDFIANIFSSKKDRILVESINQLSHALGLKVVAERVESDDVLRMLDKLHVDFAQGYYLGAPARNLPDVAKSGYKWSDYL